MNNFHSKLKGRSKTTNIFKSFAIEKRNKEFRRQVEPQDDASPVRLPWKVTESNGLFLRQFFFLSLGDDKNLKPRTRRVGKYV